MVQVKVQPHHRFEVKGADLSLTLVLETWEAALGTKKVVDTLEGEITLSIPPGSQGGQRLRIKGRGLNETGALFVGLRIKISKPLSGEQQSLYERLAALEATADPQ